MEIGQSEPGMRKWEMQLHLDQWERPLRAEGMLDWREKKQKIPALLGDRQEGVDDQHGLWQDPMLGVVRTSRKYRQEGVRQTMELTQLLLALKKGS
jgi:hypothetical protein